MKLSSKGRYAVMGLADIARFNQNEPISLRDISLRQGISLSYLEQLFSKLKNRKLVKSVRGPLGGYVLEKNPDNIKISNIIFAVNEEVKTLKCTKDSKKSCQGKSVKCITHYLWLDLEQHINDFFDSTNLGDLTREKQSDLN